MYSAGSRRHRTTISFHEVSSSNRTFLIITVKMFIAARTQLRTHTELVFRHCSGQKILDGGQKQKGPDHRSSCLRVALNETRCLNRDMGASAPVP
jgi:hypothetical protein